MTDQALPLATSRAEPRTGSFKVPHFVGRTITYLLLSLAAFVSIFPFFWMVVGATNRSVDIGIGKATFGDQLLVNAANFFATVDAPASSGTRPSSPSSAPC